MNFFIKKHVLFDKKTNKSIYKSFGVSNGDHYGKTNHGHTINLEYQKNTMVTERMFLLKKVSRETIYSVKKNSKVVVREKDNSKLVN